ncbi:LysE family translocator [Sphingopyxis indica]|uniref:LysE family translocator n=1 Tax=Sphingopyxis indica TaxID=436663 RepID=UPI002938D386|nr:LysE family transporter [Sphingopyxis indica]
MNQTALLALSAFAFVSSITPGPNNMMLMASGANFGLRRTVPHALGVGLGFMLMIVLVGVGLMGLFDLFPALGTILKVVSTAEQKSAIRRRKTRPSCYMPGGVA